MILDVKSRHRNNIPLPPKRRIDVWKRQLLKVTDFLNRRNITTSDECFTKKDTKNLFLRNPFILIRINFESLKPISKVFPLSKAQRCFYRKLLFDFSISFPSTLPFDLGIICIGKMILPVETNGVGSKLAGLQHTYLASHRSCT